MKSEAIVALARKRRVYKKSVVFFCSSAGEFEQAKPVIWRLERAGVFCHVFFFSRSGYSFAQARKEITSFCLAPWDVVWSWGGILSALAPSASVIVRHEFWPGFIGAARNWGPLFLLDAVTPSRLNREPGWKTNLSTRWKRFILLWANIRVFTVDKPGTDFFVNRVGCLAQSVNQIGDTKYDRVVERTAQISGHENQGSHSFWAASSRPVLIVGSAHLPDLELVLNACSLNSAPKLHVLVVPHDVSSSNISLMCAKFKRMGWAYELSSELKSLSGEHPQLTPNVALIVDSIGQLSELYKGSDLAFVGGAVHAKVHNGLEPAAWGIPLTSGILINNSQEALHLCERRLLVASNDPQKLIETWHAQISGRDQWSKALREEVLDLTGASEKFFTFLMKSI
ncbi:MAG: hypothetical protein NTV34_15590 [Proteobacteria bacterium]|nr:hypothetical protein [Pseudomonadota bacterium]